MIAETAYLAGVDAAHAMFKLAAGALPVPVTMFPKKVPVTTSATPRPPAGPVVGGAAAGPGTLGGGGVPMQTPAAGGGWKGVAKDVAIQAAVPLGLMGVQAMMTPSQKDPNAQ